MRIRLCTALPRSQKPPSTPHPFYDGYEGGDFFATFKVISLGGILFGLLWLEMIL